MKPIKPAIATLALLTLVACSSPQATEPNGTVQSQSSTTSASARSPESNADTSTSSAYTELVTPTSDSLGDTSPETPSDLAQQLAEGGLVIVHRYTGAMRPSNPRQHLQVSSMTVSAFPSPASRA